MYSTCNQCSSPTTRNNIIINNYFIDTFITFIRALVIIRVITAMCPSTDKSINMMQNNFNVIGIQAIIVSCQTNEVLLSRKTRQLPNHQLNSTYPSLTQSHCQYIYCKLQSLGKNDCIVL